MIDLIQGHIYFYYNRSNDYIQALKYHGKHVAQTTGEVAYKLVDQSNNVQMLVNDRMISELKDYKHEIMCLVVEARRIATQTKYESVRDKITKLKYESAKLQNKLSELDIEKKELQEQYPEEFV